MQNSIMEVTVAAHRDQYGVEPTSVAWAPGRIEVLGNHTDYNEGTVLSAAIDRGHCYCISRSNLPGIRVLAADLHESAEFSAGDPARVSGFSWANYSKGVFYLLSQHLGRAIDGLDCTFMGSIPMGAGLSSSAALEVAAAFAALDAIGEQIELKQLAALCRKAEHQFAGTNCGLLDQFSSIFGKEHGLIYSDFRSLEVRAVTLPHDVAFLIVNPHVKHSLADSPYNERRERCEQAAKELAAILPYPVRALRDVRPADFEAFRHRIDSAAARRAAHIVGEIDRVERGRELLGSGGIEAFGELLFESHASSIENFENSCAELDVVVAAAREAGAIGARLSGGGFGGCAIVLVPTDRIEELSRRIITLSRHQGIDPDIIAAYPSAGAHLLRRA